MKLIDNEKLESVYLLTDQKMWVREMEKDKYVIFFNMTDFMYGKIEHQNGRKCLGITSM